MRDLVGSSLSAILRIKVSELINTLVITRFADVLSGTGKIQAHAISIEQIGHYYGMSNSLTNLFNIFIARCPFDSYLQ